MSEEEIDEELTNVRSVPRSSPVSAPWRATCLPVQPKWVPGSKWVQVPTQDAPKVKRFRRTKAQMAADRAAGKE